MTFFKNNRCLKVEDIKCSNCIHAHKVEDEYGKMYECDAEEFDTERLTCFMPKEE